MSYRHIHHRTVDLILVAVALICCAIAALWCYAQGEAAWYRQENTISVAEPPPVTRTEKALESMAKAFHGWAR